MTGETSGMERRLLYFADPMCSWCWGFAPVITALVAQAGQMAPLRLVMGGLRPGATRPMSERAKVEVRHHWEEVAASTGQPFDYSFFDRSGFIYDTEPACRATVVVHSRARVQALAYMKSVQFAFYAENRDVTDLTTLAGLAAPFDIDAESFEADFMSTAAVQTTIANFQLTQTLGVAGFPTVILRDSDGFSCLTAGYQPLTALAPLLDEWLRRQPS
jgi:Predicted protein-disulfide isomerase